MKKLLGLLRVTQFAKKRETKLAQIAELAEPFAATETFLETIGLQPAISFRLEVVRHQILEACACQKVLAGPVEAAAEKMAPIHADFQVCGRIGRYDRACRRLSVAANHLPGVVR